MGRDRYWSAGFYFPSSFKVVHGTTSGRKVPNRFKHKPFPCCFSQKTITLFLTLYKKNLASYRANIYFVAWSHCVVLAGIKGIHHNTNLGACKRLLNKIGGIFVVGFCLTFTYLLYMHMCFCESWWQASSPPEPFHQS